MMNDSNGCSLCQNPGQERYEYFMSRVGRKPKKLVQYDYRHIDGELFSCVASNLEACRLKRDEWLKRKEA